MEFNKNELKEKLNEASEKIEKISKTLEQKGDKVGLYSQLEWENLKGQYDELIKNVGVLTQKVEMIGKVKKDKMEDKIDEIKSKVELGALGAKYGSDKIIVKIDELKKDASILFEKMEMIGKVRANKFGKHLDDAKSKAELEALSVKFEYENLVAKIKNLIKEHKENKENK